MKNLVKRLSKARDVLGRDTTDRYLSNLAKILRAENEFRSTRLFQERIELLVSEFQTASGHSVMNALRWFDVQAELSYRDILEDAATHLGLPVSSRHRIEVLENRILESFLTKLWQKLSAEHKKKLRDEILKSLDRNADKVDPKILKKIAAGGAPFAAIFAGQAAGFALYTAATTALSAVSSTLGFTLAFGAYTTLTKGISVLLGPFGLALGAMFAAYQLGSPSYEKKLIPCILLFTLLRSEMEMSRAAARAKSKRKVGKKKSKKL